MRVVDIIQKKRENEVLKEEEIKFLLEGYHKGEVPDYQVASFLMAVYFNGMETDELKVFTETMIESGDTIDFPGIEKFLIDKHSTGGVGDKTTIALAPIFGALGMGTAKLSGKGLGHTGGTIDKFESIKGFKFCNTKDELVKIVNETGTGLMGQAETIVPLDKKLYALRDVTATVASIPLISSSIMSKKLAVHADGIILDVKVGSGAFMKNLNEAKDLAVTMYKLGKAFDRNIVCMLTNMDEPLGNAVGNSLEVVEAIETLKGNGPSDFTQLVENLGAQALILKGDVKTTEEGVKKVKEVIENGEALKMLKRFIKGSGGDENICNDYSLLDIAKNKVVYSVEKSGYIKHIDAEKIGRVAMMLGAGRATKEDEIDHSVGLVIHKKVGDKFESKEPLLTLYYKHDVKDEIIEILDSAFIFSNEKVERLPIILDIIN